MSLFASSSAASLLSGDIHPRPATRYSLLLQSYFRSGWAFLFPYLAAYLLYAWLRWPVNPAPGGEGIVKGISRSEGLATSDWALIPSLLHVYWALHAIHLILGAIALRSWWREWTTGHGQRTTDYGLEIKKTQNCRLESEPRPLASRFFAYLSGILTVGALISGLPLTWGALWLPALLLPLLLTALGLSLDLAAPGVFWRDIGQLTQFLSLALLFARAVFYPVEQILLDVHAILQFNPLLLTIQEARCAVFWHQLVNLTHLAYLYGLGLCVYFLGAVNFQHLRTSFADVL